MDWLRGCPTEISVIVRDDGGIDLPELDAWIDEQEADLPQEQREALQKLGDALEAAFDAELREEADYRFYTEVRPDLTPPCWCGYLTCNLPHHKWEAEN